MGITTKSITIVTCDICSEKCDESDSSIEIQVNGGSRDVGAAYIRSKLSFYQLYSCTDGIVCNTCKLKYLTDYVKELSIAIQDKDAIDKATIVRASKLKF